MYTIFSKNYSNDAIIAAGGYWRGFISSGDSDAAKFFNFYVVHNTTNSDFKLIYDGIADDYDIVPAGAIAIKTGKKFRFLVGYNMDAVNAIGIDGINIRVEKQVEKALAVYD